MAKYYGYGPGGLCKGKRPADENADALLASMDANPEPATPRKALLYQAVAESLSVTPTQEQLDRYSSYNRYMARITAAWWLYRRPLCRDAAHRRCAELSNICYTNAAPILCKKEQGAAVFCLLQR